MTFTAHMAWQALEGAAAQATTKLQASESHFHDTLAKAKARIQALSQDVELKQASIELRPRTPIDLDSCLGRLRDQGPQTLSARERRALASHPDRVPILDLTRLLQHAPDLLRHLLRAALSNWYRFKAQPWGVDCLALISKMSRGSGIAFLEGSPLGPQQALSRDDPSGDMLLARSLPPGPIVAIYERIQAELGLRDSWLYTARVMTSWLELQFASGKSLDESLDAVRGHERLRAMLLPARRGSELMGGVRVDTLAQATAIATFLRSAFTSPSQLSKARLADLTEEMFRSDFRDPRLPPMSQGWELVRQLAEGPFRKFLSSLSEQDLEVFFAHAMNEPDRRRFWLTYLPYIERTGCILDSGSQERLKQILDSSPELRGALDRAHRFRRTSHVQAFFLVFPSMVIVEFSDRGNAAYVYRREYFESVIEPNVRHRRCDSASDLKIKTERIHKIDHHRSWQDKTAEWLSTRGIHARPRR